MPQQAKIRLRYTRSDKNNIHGLQIADRGYFAL